MFNMAKVQTALKILEIWLDSSQQATQRGTPLARLYAIRWRAFAFIIHDRVLNGRQPLNPILFKNQPGA